MYKLIRVYDDGTIIEGHHLFTEFDIEQLACLVCQLKAMTYEFTIALEVDND